MIRAAAALALALLPQAGQAYQVAFENSAFGARGSELRPVDLGRSQLAPAGQAGNLRAVVESSALSASGDTGGLVPRAEVPRLGAPRAGYLLVARVAGSLAGEESRLQPTRNLPVSHLRKAALHGGLAARPMQSATRLAEVQSGMRDKAEALLTEFGAREEGGKIIVSLPGDVLFDFDKSEIRADAEPVLARMAELLDAFSASPVVIVGRTDSKGADDYNLALSDRRAASVKDWLAEEGVGATRMTTEGHGEAEPVAPNEHADGRDDPEGRQKNRRVEFAILQPAP